MQPRNQSPEATRRPGRPLPAARPTSTACRFLVGQDDRGHWVVCDMQGLVGGVFFDRSSAMHFAMAESDYRPGAVCCAPTDTILSMEPLFRPATARTS